MSARCRSKRDRDCDEWAARIVYPNVTTFMPIITRFNIAALLSVTLLTLAAMPAQARLYSLATSGTISENSSGDSTIPVGTPWSFELLMEYDIPDWPAADCPLCKSGVPINTRYAHGQDFLDANSRV